MVLQERDLGTKCSRCACLGQCHWEKSILCSKLSEICLGYQSVVSTQDLIEESTLFGKQPYPVKELDIPLQDAQKRKDLFEH